MGIIFHEETKTFHLTNGKISYIMTVLPNGHLGNLYYGKAIRDREDFSHLLELVQRPMFQYVYDDDRLFSLESVKQELPVYGTTDYRAPMVEVLQSNGSRISDFVYVSHEVNEGKPKLEALPATYTENDDEAETLIVTLKDSLTGIKARMLYTIWSDRPVIAKSVEYVNEGTEAVHLTTAYSMCLDLPDPDYQWMQLSGAWARERNIITRDLEQGVQSIGSNRGHSSHEHNPFIVLKRETTDENQGEAIGISLVYSGNFKIQAEVDTRNTARILAGINPDTFDWKLDAGEHFQTPEAVIVYSDQGLNKMSQTFHKLYQKRLARGEWRDKPRPILINNWEATYFDFDTDKLLAIAKSAAEHGIEMLVMDDGWFGHRNDDATSLGDWFVNENKIKGGLKHLVDEVNKLGLKFGIWMEPEMISPDSELYRKHPDWAFAVPERTATLSRNQYVLDLSRKEVRDYVYECVHNVISSANIEYVKWDMNRQLTDIGSVEFTGDRQGELAHRYVLGVYELQERLVNDFPDLLLENCSGGGARFDPGMLYYSPQIWCSDDTDAIERLSIQEGTELIYPLSTMGAHVSDCPNHTVGRSTPFMTRAHVALAGTFGYELDITKISEEERAMIPEQVSMYHKYNDLVREGDYYRVASYRENGLYDCWMVVAKDKSEALVTYVQVLGRPNVHSRKIKLLGLDVAADYRLDGTEKVYGGDLLMNAGMLIETMRGDYMSRLYHFVLDNSLT